MADETMQPAEAAAPVATPVAREFVCVTGVLHGEGSDLPKRYEPGETITLSDEATIAQLRKVGAIKLPEELMAADELAARQAALDAENAQLRAELEALRAAQAPQPAAKPASKSAKADA